MAVPDVAVVSSDLILTSRLRAALAGLVRVTVALPGAVPDAATVFVDLNQDAEARLELISRIRAAGGAHIIGFCQHDDRDLRVRAMERGADQVVTNGALQQAALRLVGAGAGG